MSDIRGVGLTYHIFWGKSYGPILPKSGQIIPYRGRDYSNDSRAKLTPIVIRATLMKVPKICGRLDPPLMSDIRPPSNLPHSLAKIGQNSTSPKLLKMHSTQHHGARF